MEEGLLAAMALLADCQVSELGSHGSSVISKALGAVLYVYDATLTCVGSTASRLAEDIIEVWDQADSRWEYYTEVYGGSKKFSYDGKEVLRVSMSPLDPGAYYILATDGRDPNLLYATGDYFNLQTSVDGAFI